MLEKWFSIFDDCPSITDATVRGPFLSFLTSAKMSVPSELSPVRQLKSLDFFNFCLYFKDFFGLKMVKVSASFHDLMKIII